MRADSLGRWYARFAVVSALGAAALTFAAGPAAAADNQLPGHQASVGASDSSAATEETDWGAPAGRALRLVETDWG